MYVEVEIFWYHLGHAALFPHKQRHSESNDVFSFDEESVKASPFMLLKRYQYLLIQTHVLNWIVELTVEVGFN